MRASAVTDSARSASANIPLTSLNVLLDILYEDWVANVQLRHIFGLLIFNSLFSYFSHSLICRIRCSSLCCGDHGSGPCSWVRAGFAQPDSPFALSCCSYCSSRYVEISKGARGVNWHLCSCLGVGRKFTLPSTPQNCKGLLWRFMSLSDESAGCTSIDTIPSANVADPSFTSSIYLPTRHHS